MLKELNRAVSVIDTEALGVPNAVAAYLVTGTETALIDMGYRSSAKTVVEDLTGQGIGPDDLDYLLPTHVHLDHCGAAGALLKRFSKASVRVHPKGELHLVDPTRLWNGATQLFGVELMQRYGHPEPIDQNRLQVASDGDVLDLGRGIVLRAVWTPGHASHHLSYEWEGHRAFFTGDAVGLYHPNFPILVPTTPPTSFNLDKMLQSLEVLKSSSPVEFFTPHFGVVKNASQWIEENIKALSLWRSYIEEMKRSGLTVEKMTDAMIEKTCRRLGRLSTEMPEHLRVAIKISILGVLRYLDLAGPEAQD